MDISVSTSEYAANTRAFALIAEGWNDLVQEGLTPDYLGECPVKPSDKVVYAYSGDGDPIGVITYRPDKVHAKAVITLAYVEPSSRRQHVFREMLSVLMDQASNADLLTVSMEVDARNNAAATVCSHLQGELMTRVFEFTF